MPLACTTLRLSTGALLLSLALAQGCGGSNNPGSLTPPTTTPTGPTTPSVTVTASSTSISTAQSLQVNVAVSGSPAGTVVLSSGNYATFPATLSAGAASFTVPAGVLAPGSATLTAAFTSSSTTTVSSASGTSALTVTAANATLPVVTATPVTYPTADQPFRAVPLPSGQVLVSVGSTTGSNVLGIQLFSPSGSALAPGCVNLLGNNLLNGNANALSMTLAPNGLTVGLALGDSGVDFFSVADLTSCSGQGNGTFYGQGSGAGTIGVAFSPDGKYAFVANEYAMVNGFTSPGAVGILSLTYDAAGHVTATQIGQISTGGNAVPGVTVSPDGTRLYVTSEISTSSTPANVAGSSNPTLTHGGCLQANLSNPMPNGTLTVIDAAKAEAGAGQSAVISTVNAGCSPTRVVETSDNTTLYVSARGDNNVLVFSTGMLDLNPGNALLAAVSTGGTAPVGLQLFHGQKLLAVANSNRFGFGASANATILNVAVPTAPAVVQTIPTGLFPREWSLASDDSTLYLSNFMSNTIEVIPTSVQ